VEMIDSGRKVWSWESDENAKAAEPDQMINDGIDIDRDHADLREAAEEQARRDEAELDALASHAPATPCPSAPPDGTDSSPTPSPGCPSPTRAASASAADSSGSADTFTELFRCDPWVRQALYNRDYMDEEADTEDVGTDTEDEETREIGGAVTRPLSHELASVPHMAGRAGPDDDAVADVVVDRTTTCPPPVLPPCVEQRLWGSTETCTHPDGRMETCAAPCDPTIQALVATPGT